jgi:hypothetical protein
MFEEVRNAMKTTMKRHKWSRGAGLGLAAILLLVLSGDGIGAAISPHGIDPLDVLDLQVKPNVIIVLDSSGSMQESLGRDSAGNSPAWIARYNVICDIPNWRAASATLRKGRGSPVSRDRDSAASCVSAKRGVTKGGIERTSCDASQCTGTKSSVLRSVIASFVTSNRRAKSQECKAER